MLGSVTQACRTLHSGDEKYGFRCRRVPFILTSFCLAPFGNENGLKCRLKVSCRTLGRRKWAEVSPESVVLHSWATKMYGSVAQACRTLLSSNEKYGFRCRRVPFILTSFCLAPLGNEKARKCHPSVPYFTLGRRKVWVSLPKSPLHPYVILPYTHGQQKWTEVLPESVVLHSRATKSVDFVAEESLHPYVILPCTFRQRKWAEVSPESVVLHSRATKMLGSVTQACRVALSGDDIGLKCCLRWVCGITS